MIDATSLAAVGITGTTMITDSGYFSAGVTESFPDATPIVNFLDIAGGKAKAEKIEVGAVLKVLDVK